VARNRLTVPKSASLTNVLNDSHWLVEVAGDGRMSRIGGTGMESVEVCMIGSGEMAVTFSFRPLKFVDVLTCTFFGCGRRHDMAVIVKGYICYRSRCGARKWLENDEGGQK
jgi:hypothetical protein